MTKPRKPTLRAFVAMAIGRTETDEVFDHLIKPALASANILARRVDRIEHNDDIDDRIMAEIESCDFVVADLTFARPSVYFEAGYAERSVPVIYTCRRDHLSPRPDDEMGNFRVHFDLQMKNIIAWIDCNDRAFSEALARRAKMVIVPAVRERMKEAQQRELAGRFESLPVHRRTERLLKLAVATLRGAGFTLTSHDLRPPGENDLVRLLHDMDRAETVMNVIVGWKWDLGVLKHVIVWAGPLPRQALYQRVRDLAALNHFYIVGPDGQFNRTPEHLVDLVILCSLGRVTRSRVALALPQFARERSGTYVFKTNQAWPQELNLDVAALYPTKTPSWIKTANLSAKMRPGAPEIGGYLYARDGYLVGGGSRSLARLVTVPRIVRVAVIDGLKSEESFIDAIRTLVGRTSGTVRTRKTDR